ncbi:Separin [Thelohanellus kitauei]|uniref:separase n=1 Tax=Thelohanellus kitauei TaxID=669202 RepID=A0A0C2N3M1_THEKT|nr:Separin [Thelohanellus kitauei]
MPSLYSISLSLHNWKEKLKDGHVYLDGDRCYFVLNPGQNLDRTQKFFEDTFKSIPRWTGLISKPPTENECLAALQNHDLFLYCGHGNGKQYIKNDFLKKCVCKAVPILMGCYSAKLYKYKDGDPMGTVYYYLMTGSPAVVANLWGVTDKDIDQFLNNVLYDILKNSVSVAESVAKNRSICHLKNLNGAAPIVYGIPVKFSFVDYPQPSKC